MLKSNELNSLLEKGRSLHNEIEAFIKKESSALSSLELTKRIDNYIGDITLQLLTPSGSENTKLALLMSNLGQTIKDLKNIKPMLTNNVQSSTHTFFKSKPYSQTSRAPLEQLTGDLNQLENYLVPSIGPASAA